MNIDLLCGHDTILHCGCMECAKEDLQSKLSKAREVLLNIKDTWGYSDDTFDEIRKIAAEALKVIGEA